ncbi:MAG: VCBS domain-containing protein [Campylobacterota bacterium]
MATGKVIGKIEVASIGGVKIVGVDGAMRDATYEGLMYEGEQLVSNDPETLFQIRYLALPEATVYEGVFGVLADGSVIADVSELETLFGDDIDFMETAAGDGEPEANSGIPEDAGIVANAGVQGFERGENSGVGLGTKATGPEAGGLAYANRAPVAEDGAISAIEDLLDVISGQLEGSDAEGSAIEFVLVDGLAEDGSEGNLVLNPDGTYTYQLDAGDFDYLSRGETTTVTFTYKTVEADGGLESEIATVTITITGTNDRPAVTDINNGTYESYDSTDNLGEDDTVEDVYTTFTGTIDTVTDVDLSDEHTYEIVGNIEENVDVSDENVVVTSVSISYNPDTEAWEYTVVADANSLAVGETATITFDYRAIDDSGFGANSLPNEPSLSIPATITLTIMGTNDQPIVADVVVEDLVLEGVASGNMYTFTGELSVEDADVTDTHTFHLDNALSGKGATQTAEVTVSDADGNPLDIVAHVHLQDSGDFNITGDFDSLADGEEATVTFSYYAVDDNNLDGTDFTNETSVSEIKELTLTITGTDDSTLVLTSDTLDLSGLTGLNTVVLETGANVINQIDAEDVLNATDDDNTLVIRSYDGDASDQVDVHDDFGDATEVLNDGQWYAEYSADGATLLVEIDTPIDVV